MSSEGYPRTVFTDAIAEHLALRERNRDLEERMPLRDYLPLDYLPQVAPSQSPLERADTATWFEEGAGELGWAA